MAGLVPAIHDFALVVSEVVGGRRKGGYDEAEVVRALNKTTPRRGGAHSRPAQ